MNCLICCRKLNVPDEPDSLDCGGDCLRCMAEMGDPECVLSLAKKHRSKAQTHIKIIKFISLCIFYVLLAIALACGAWALIIDAALKEDTARMAKLDRQMLRVIAAHRPLLRDCELHDTCANCLVVTKQGKLSIVQLRQPN